MKKRETSLKEIFERKVYLLTVSSGLLLDVTNRLIENRNFIHHQDVQTMKNYNDKIKRLKQEIEKLHEYFNISIIMENDYVNDEKTNIVLKRNGYGTKLTEIGYIINTYFKSIVHLTKNPGYKSKLLDIGNFLDSNNEIKLEEKYEINTINMCSICGNEMKILMISSEMVCDYCGNTITLEGILFNNQQLFAEGVYTTKNNYDPVNYSFGWWKHIHGEKIKNIPEEHIKNLKEKINRDFPQKGDKYAITCETIRDYLKDLGLTTYNKYIPSLMKMITDIDIPQPTVKENNEIEDLLKRAIIAFNEIMEEESNTPKRRYKKYIPYFIYKIIEYKFANTEKIRILNYIHLQEDSTTIKRDISWKRMCETVHLKGLIRPITTRRGEIFRD